MSRYSLFCVYFDVDGTLLNLGATTISPRTEQALKALQEQGVKICMATGRALTTLPVFDGIVFDAILAFNGSYCFAGNDVIWKHPIPTKDVQKIIENAKEMKRPVAIATEDTIVANGVDQDLKDYFAVAHETVRVTEKFQEFAQKDVYQMMQSCTLEERKLILEGTENAKIAAWWDRAVDIIPRVGGKGIAIEKVLDYYRLSKEDAIAFGDGMNDLEMFQAVGMGIAMGNASLCVKESADDICGSVAEDGIYHYLKKKQWIV